MPNTAPEIPVGELACLKGLGPKSEKQLNHIGIFTEAELRKVGAIQTFIQLKKQSNTAPSLNFLYALIGALEGKHWLDIAHHEKGKLLLELEGIEELESMLIKEGLHLDAKHE